MFIDKEVVWKMVSPYIKNSFIYDTDFEEIFDFLSDSEKIDIMSLLCEEYSVKIKKSSSQKRNIYAKQTDEDNFEVLYDDSIFKDTELQIQALKKDQNSNIHQTNEELCKQIQFGNKEARQNICIKNYKLVLKYAKKYEFMCRGRLEINDLVQEGFIGLLLAAERFQRSYGTAFTTYAVFWIKQRIIRGISDTANSIRIPIHMQERIYQIEQLDKKFSIQGYNYKERVLLIADSLEESEEWVREGFRIRDQFYQIVSTDTLVGEHEESPLIDFVPDQDMDVQREADSLFLKEKLDEVLQSLTPREAKVLRLRFGLDDGIPRTLEEVGKEFNVTRERIRQIEEKAIRKLRKRCKTNKIRDFLEVI